jgi:hypothetical protein
MLIIDFYFLVQIHLPAFLRKTITIDLIMIFISPIDRMKSDFYTFFNAKKYELSFNGQVCSLEQLLNNEFDSNLRRIYIDDLEQLPEYYLFNKEENNEVKYLFNESEGETPTYLYNQEEYDLDNDFTIYIPSGLVFDELYFKALVNQYKTASKRFNIVQL